MGTNNVVFLEVIEWFDETGKEIVHRIPEEGSGEIKFGAQLTVRPSQSAVFFYQGKAYDVFGPGRHTLRTLNLPILTKVLSIPWGMTSPLKAEVYFVNMKNFPNLKWGTRDPVAFRDKTFGLIRLRAFGVFEIKVIQPVLLINSLVGTQGIYSTDEIETYISNIIVSRFNDYMGEYISTLIDLPGKYEEIAEGIRKKVKEDLAQYGILLNNLYINSITAPQEVQKAIDDKSKLGIFSNLDELMKLKAAMALEKAASQGGEALQMGLGLLLPGLFKESLTQKETTQACPECKNQIPADSRFCPYCGHQVVIIDKCTACGKNLSANAAFCPRCGTPVSKAPKQKICKKCNAVNVAESIFCNQCGERL